MSRQRDYQPTIDRARGQAEIAKRREAKLRDQKDECHREMLRAQAAARIANEEADALRDRNLGLENSIRDLRRENRSLKAWMADAQNTVAGMRQDIEDAKHPWRAAWRSARAKLDEMLKIGAEA